MIGEKFRWKFRETFCYQFSQHVLFTVLLIAYNVAGCCVAATAQQKRGKNKLTIFFKGGGIFFVTFSLASKLSWRQVEHFFDVGGRRFYNFVIREEPAFSGPLFNTIR